jgi:hypothetical protein
MGKEPCMGQPGMRVTVDAAMRARDVSRPGIAADPGEVPATQGDGGETAGGATGGTDGERDVRGTAERDDAESRPQRDRRSKGERRRLSKRHARARR